MTMPGHNFESQSSLSGFALPREPLTPGRPTDEPRRKWTLSSWVRALRRKLNRSA
jgi:hypothetical protein